MAAIVPWNFPVALVVWGVGPGPGRLVCGLLARPAQEAPLAAGVLCDLAERAGLPPGLVTCLTGDGPLPGEALATHPRVAKVAFTGSRRVAELIASWAAPRLKALCFKLGGHGPLVVLPDADLDVAARWPSPRRDAERRPGLLRGLQLGRWPCLKWPGTCSSDARAHRLDVVLGPMATERGLARHRMLLEGTPAPPAPAWRVARSRPRVAPAASPPPEPAPRVRLIDEEPFTRSWP